MTIRYTNSIHDCESLCVSAHWCTGVEFQTHSGYCELWSVPIGYHDYSVGFECVRLDKKAPDPCAAANTPCGCAAVGGACGWSTATNQCVAGKSTSCQECPSQNQCDPCAAAHTPCGCAAIGGTCGWSKTNGQCVAGNTATTSCQECSSQSKCIPRDCSSCTQQGLVWKQPSGSINGECVANDEDCDIGVVPAAFAARGGGAVNAPAPPQMCYKSREACPASKGPVVGVKLLDHAERCDPSYPELGQCKNGCTCRVVWSGGHSCQGWC